MGKSYQTSFWKQGPPPSSNSSLLDVLLNTVLKAGLVWLKQGLKPPPDLLLLGGPSAKLVNTPFKTLSFYECGNEGTETSRTFIKVLESHKAKPRIQDSFHLILPASSELRPQSVFSGPKADISYTWCWIHKCWNYINLKQAAVTVNKFNSFHFTKVRWKNISNQPSFKGIEIAFPGCRRITTHP